ncbi:transposase [Asaia krungthepensis NRIC 0535]|uniref:Transposase n=1 Tax=Asaia krungthepensis NRIC 0535 TaxID=1307925 RepID=A0ABQ0Q4Y4_9PROT|nr:transposase [Asaia krungthepensis NRIC 0535]
MIWVDISDSVSSKRLEMSDLEWLTDEQVAHLEPFFPRSHGRLRVDDRLTLSGEPQWAALAGCSAGIWAE